MVAPCTAKRRRAERKSSGPCPAEHYEIPAFQRPYVWNEEDQWAPLWDDVVRVAESYVSAKESGIEPAIPQHFLGAVVFESMAPIAGDVTRHEVIDGQQRMTTLQLLLDAGASMASLDNAKMTALTFAVQYSHEGVTELLLARKKEHSARGIEIRAGGGFWTPLCAAAGLDDKEMALRMTRLLLEGGEAVNACNLELDTPLLTACKNEQDGK